MLYIDVLTEELRQKGYSITEKPNPIEGRKIKPSNHSIGGMNKESNIDSRIKVYWTRERGIIC